MNIFKKTLCVLMALSMSLSLVACGNKTSSTSTTNTTAQSTSQEASSEVTEPVTEETTEPVSLKEVDDIRVKAIEAGAEISFGEIKDNVYSNESLGIQFAIPESFTVLSTEEAASKVGAEMVDKASGKLVKQQGTGDTATTQAYDFVAVNEEHYETLFVSISNLKGDDYCFTNVNEQLTGFIVGLSLDNKKTEEIQIGNNTFTKIFADAKYGVNSLGAKSLSGEICRYTLISSDKTMSIDIFLTTVEGDITVDEFQNGFKAM